MKSEEKIDILTKTLERINKENTELKKQINNFPSIKQTIEDLLFVKNEYDKLNKELTEQITKYKKINDDIFQIKQDLYKIKKEI